MDTTQTKQERLQNNQVFDRVALVHLTGCSERLQSLANQYLLRKGLFVPT